MIERIGVRIRSEYVEDIIRLRKKDRDEAVKPVINKWMVLRNKADLREREAYIRVILEHDLSRGETEKSRERIQERKEEWVMTGKAVQIKDKLCNCENGVEECKCPVCI